MKLRAGTFLTPELVSRIASFEPTVFHTRSVVVYSKTAKHGMAYIRTLLQQEAWLKTHMKQEWIAAIEAYITESGVNDYLREDRTLNQYESAKDQASYEMQIRGLDDLLASIPLTEEEMIVYRGITATYPEEPVTLAKGYASCSFDQDTATMFATLGGSDHPSLLTITIPVGSQVLLMPAFARALLYTSRTNDIQTRSDLVHYVYTEKQQEVLIARNAVFRTQSIEDTAIDATHTLRFANVEYDESLLE